MIARTLSLGILIALLSSSLRASPVMYTFGPGGEFSGSGGVLSGTVAATFTDVMGGVQLGIDTSSLTNMSESVAQFYFNFDELTVTGLTYSSFAGVVPMSIGTSSDRGTTGFAADGDGMFNVVVNYSSFGTGLTSTFLIQDADGILTAMDFASQFSVGGPTGYEAALQVQGLGDIGQTIGFFAPVDAPPAVPEPTTLSLFGLGLAGAAAARRRRGRKTA